MGRLSTIDLLVLTDLDKLPLILQTLFVFFTKRYLYEEVNCTAPTPSVSVPCLDIWNPKSLKSRGVDVVTWPNVLVPKIPNAQCVRQNFWKGKPYLKCYSMGLYHPLDGNTNLKYKLLCFLTSNKKISKKMALAFNRDRCCHLVLCLWLILFHLMNTICKSIKWQLEHL